MAAAASRTWQACIRARRPLVASSIHSGCAMRPAALPAPVQSPQAEAAILQLVHRLSHGGSGSSSSAGSDEPLTCSVLAGSHVLQLRVWHSMPMLVHAAAAVEWKGDNDFVREVSGWWASAGWAGMGCGGCLQHARRPSLACSTPPWLLSACLGLTPHAGLTPPPRPACLPTPQHAQLRGQLCRWTLTGLHVLQQAGCLLVSELEKVVCFVLMALHGSAEAADQHG